MVLETKLCWPPLQLRLGPASICVCIHPHLLQMLTSRQYFNMGRIKCLSLAKTEVDGGDYLLESPIFSHSFTAGVGTTHMM